MHDATFARRHGSELIRRSRLANFFGSDLRGHAKFFDAMPQEYERRVVGFFDRYVGTVVRRNNGEGK